MAEKKAHKRMSSSEQARLSQSRYGQDAQQVPPTTPRGDQAQKAQAARHARHASTQADQPAAYVVQPQAVVAATSTPSRSKRGKKRGPGAQVTSRAEGAASYTALRKKRGRRGHIIRGVFIALFAVLVVGVGAAWAYVHNIDTNFQNDLTDDFKRQLQDTAASIEPEDPFYMLLLGVDKSEDRASEWGDSYSNFRADTIILTRVDPKSQTVSMVSIPRDTYAYMGLDSGDYRDKINAAYSLGGPQQMVKAVEKLAGVKIAHYAEIDFEQFISIVDTIGGIEVTTPVDVVDMTYAMIDLPAGTHTLDGDTALKLCRARHAYDKLTNIGGDFIRAANQRQVIYAIVKKILSLDLFSMVTTVTQLSESVTTDYTTSSIVNLALEFKDLDTENGIYSGQLPTNSQYVNNIWYEYVDEDGWSAMMERVDQGLPPYESEDQDITAGLAGTVGNNVTGDGTDTSSAETNPVYTGSVLVLNGTATSGFALNKANTLISAGFSAQANNATTTDHATTLIYYNEGMQGEALGVADTLGVDSGNVQANDGTYSTDYDVVVILGSDLS